MLNHMGLVVADLEKSYDFYVNVVGMTPESCLEVESEAFDALMSSEGNRVKFWYLNLNGFRLQIMKYLRGAGSDLALRHNKRGCPHLCINVDDVQLKYDEIARRADINVVSKIVTQRSGRLVAHSFYVEDPDGVPIEFAQIDSAS